MWHRLPACVDLHYRAVLFLPQILRPLQGAVRFGSVPGVETQVETPG
jgi:hypothetical protein